MKHIFAKAVLMVLPQLKWIGETACLKHYCKEGAELVWRGGDIGLFESVILVGVILQKASHLTGFAVSLADVTIHSFQILKRFWSTDNMEQQSQLVTLKVAGVNSADSSKGIIPLDPLMAWNVLTNCSPFPNFVRLPRVVGGDFVVQ